LLLRLLLLLLPLLLLLLLLLLLMLLLLSLLLSLLLLTYRVPFRSGGHRGETPEGRRTWMCAVRGRGRMPLPRIPVMDADPERAARRARGRARFLLVTFLCASKEK
jgi:hypothetical protein